MSTNIYKPEKSNKILFTVLIAVILTIAIGAYKYITYFLKESECTEKARKATANYFDIESESQSEYEKIKEECLSKLKSDTE